MSSRATSRSYFPPAEGKKLPFADAGDCRVFSRRHSRVFSRRKLAGRCKTSRERHIFSQTSHNSPFEHRESLDGTDRPGAIDNAEETIGTLRLIAWRTLVAERAIFPALGETITSRRTTRRGRSRDKARHEISFPDDRKHIPLVVGCAFITCRGIKAYRPHTISATIPRYIDRSRWEITACGSRAGLDARAIASHRLNRSNNKGIMIRNVDGNYGHYQCHRM